MKIIGMILVGAVIAFAVDTPIKSLSDILARAKKGTDKSALIDDGIASGVEEAKAYAGSAYPQIGLTSSYMYSYSPTNSQSQGVSQFSLDNTHTRLFNVELGFSQTLNVFRLGLVLEMEKQQVKTLESKRAFEMDMYYLAAIQHYVEALYSQYQYELDSNSLAIYRDLLAMTAIDVDAGVKSSVDEMQIKAQVGLAEASKHQSYNRSTIALRALSDFLNLKDLSSIQLHLGGLNFDLFEIADKKGEGVTKQVVLLENQLMIAQQVAEYQNSLKYPDIALVGGVKHDFMNMSFDPLSVAGSNPNDPPTVYDGMSPNETDEYYSPKHYDYSIGVAVTVPVFTGGSVTANAKKAEIDARIAKRTVMIAKREQKSKAIDAVNNLAAIRNMLKALTMSVETSKIVFEQKQSDYKVGDISLLDFKQSEQDYNTVNTEFFKAQLQELLALVNVRLTQGYVIYE
ncbi:MAG: TolC family protein [Fibrobacterales bacterium]